MYNYKSLLKLIKLKMVDKKKKLLRKNVKKEEKGFIHHIHINRCTGGHTFAQKLEGGISS